MRRADSAYPDHPSALNPYGAPQFPAAVLRGEGVLESLHALVTLVMRRLAPARVAEG